MYVFFLTACVSQTSGIYKAYIYTLEMFGDCHRQQNHYSPQAILGKGLQLQFWLRRKFINVTATAAGATPRARMNCGNQLQLQVLIPVELINHCSHRIRPFLNKFGNNFVAKAQTQSQSQKCLDSCQRDRGLFLGQRPAFLRVKKKTPQRVGQCALLAPVRPQELKKLHLHLGKISELILFGIH